MILTVAVKYRGNTNIDALSVPPGAVHLRESRAKNKFLLVSMAGGSPKDAIADAAKSLGKQ